jgi:hypothetical protein
MEGIVDEIAPNRLLGEIEGHTPGRLPLGVEEARRIVRQVVFLRSEVVVDDVEIDRDAVCMGHIDKGLHVVGRTVGTVGRIMEHAVIAPAAGAGKMRNR